MKAFIEEDPDGDGQDDTIGMVVLSEVYGGYPNNTFGIDNVFTAFGAYPASGSTRTARLCTAPCRRK